MEISSDRKNHQNFGEALEKPNIIMFYLKYPKLKIYEKNKKQVIIQDNNIVNTTYLTEIPTKRVSDQIRPPMLVRNHWLQI